MRTLITLLLLMMGSLCMAQNATDFFNSAGNQFIDGDTQTALSTVNRGLERYPSDEKLKKLRDELMKQQEQEQQQQQQEQQEQNQDQEKQNQEQQEQNQDQEKQEQEQKEQQQQEQEQNEEEQKEEQQPEDAEKTEEQKEQEKQDELEKFLEKLKDMKISREKAEMILEAMKNNEIQYVQQNKRKAKKRKDRSKPDW